MKTKQLKKDTKTFTVIKYFATGGTLHRFQAERIGDHVLPSTMFVINRDYGLSFNSEWVDVPTNFAKPVRVKKYWLEGDSLNMARLLTTETS